MFLKRNWIAVLQYKIKYSILLVLLSSLYFGCSTFFAGIFYLIISSLTSFQVVKIQWKEEYISGLMVWVNSFEQQESGVIVSNL